MNKVIDKGFRSCRFVSTIVKHPVIQFTCHTSANTVTHQTFFHSENHISM